MQPLLPRAAARHPRLDGGIHQVCQILDRVVLLDALADSTKPNTIRMKKVVLRIRDHECSPPGFNIESRDGQRRSSQIRKPLFDTVHLLFL